MEDMVIHHLQRNRIEFIPFISHSGRNLKTETSPSFKNTSTDPQDNNDHSILPNYYIQAEKYAFQLTEMNNNNHNHNHNNHNDNDNHLSTHELSVVSVLSFEYVPLKIPTRSTLQFVIFSVDFEYI
jgi:hypothetical protein